MYYVKEMNYVDSPFWADNIVFNDNIENEDIYGDFIIMGDDYSITLNANKFTEAVNALNLEMDSFSKEEICEILTKYYHHPYDYCTIMGSMQREWNTLYYRTDSSYDIDKAIENLEAEYYNIGNTYFVCEIDDDKFIPTYEDEIDGYHIYVTDYDEKRGIANILNCKEEEIKLYKYREKVVLEYYEA